MPQGGQIQIRLERQAAIAILEISDSGVGIPAEMLPKIFDPFYTTRAVGEGTGMGLSIVHGIITGMQGKIEAASTENSGTKFRIEIPIEPRSKLPSDVTPVSPVSPKQSPTQDALKRILLVDDDPSVLKSTTRLLTALGFSVQAVNNGSAALRLFSNNASSFDAILTDLTMPEMSGVEVLLAARKVQPQIPVIVASGFDLEASLAKEKELPNNLIRLSKPYRLGDLRSVLLQAVAVDPNPHGSNPKSYRHTFSSDELKLRN